MNEFYDIPDYEGIYKIDKEGNVLSTKNNIIMKPRLGGEKYLLVNLWKDKAHKTFRIHKLMAITFIDKDYRLKKLVVDHIDNDRFNNRLSNLQLISNRENTSKDKGGASKYTGVTMSPNGNWRASIRINQKKHWLGTFKTELEAHHAYQNKLKEIEEARSSENLPQISLK